MERRRKPSTPLLRLYVTVQEAKVIQSGLIGTRVWASFRPAQGAPRLALENV